MVSLISGHVIEYFFIGSGYVFEYFYIGSWTETLKSHSKKSGVGIVRRVSIHIK